MRINNGDLNSPNKQIYEKKKQIHFKNLFSFLARAEQTHCLTKLRREAIFILASSFKFNFIVLLMSNERCLRYIKILANKQINKQNNNTNKQIAINFDKI